MQFSKRTADRCFDSWQWIALYKQKYIFDIFEYAYLLTTNVAVNLSTFYTYVFGVSIGTLYWICRKLLANLKMSRII